MNEDSHLVNKFRDEMLSLAMASLSEENLTESMKFALCMAAGVPIESEWNSATNKLTFRTKHPCGVAKIEGRWNVFTNENL